MPHETGSHIDAGAAHRHFAAECFNRAWALIEKPGRTAAETEAMVLCATASLWHWTQRPDCAPRNLSVGHWQVSRVYALAGQGENAMHHAKRSLEFSETLPPFYIAYAHEAAARAAMVLQDRQTLAEHLAKAQHHAARVTDAEERKLVEDDLASLG